MLSTKSVLVVGGSSGIGLATAQAAERAGASVTIASRSAEKLAAAAATLAGARTIMFDTVNESAVAFALGALGPVDHVVVTPGGVPPSPVKGGSVAKAQAGFAGKFWSAYNVAAYANIAEAGSLTFISGVFAIRPAAGMVAASCANAAIDALARALALEFAPVRVNAVSPGLVDTPLWSGMPPEKRAAFYAATAAKQPNRYVGMPEDVAALVIACMINPMLTGSVLVVDGGSVLV